MKKYLAVGIILLLIGVNATGSFAKDTADISPVSFDGNTLYVGGTGPNNYTSIQSAIDDALDGDTVFVYDDSSPYYESIVVNKRIDLIGEDNNYTIIEIHEGHVVTITANSVLLQGFTIKGGGAGKSHISIQSDNNIIKENIIKSGTARDGIFTRSTNNNTIINNIIMRRQRGIQIEGSSSNYIISNNFISNCYMGIFFPNALYDNANNNFTIRNNLFIECSGRGIYIQQIDYLKIINNTFIENIMGTIIFYCENGVIEHNEFFNCTYGTHVDTGSNNIVRYNNYYDTKILAISFTKREFKTNVDIYHNYYGRKVIEPKVIIGIRRFYFVPDYYEHFFTIQFDKNPKEIPN